VSTPVFADERIDYPHVVRRNGRRNLRWSIDLQSDEAHRAGQPSVAPQEPEFKIDSLGPALRRTVLKGLVETARRCGEPACVVWGVHDCTWIDERGRTTDGNRPPSAEIAENHLLESQDAVMEDVWTIRLPEGCAASHLCIRHIDAVLVEITPGEPFVLGSFFDLPRDGRHDPAAAMMSRGRLKPPARFRGQPVTGVLDHWQVVGPVQPCRNGAILRDPWPEDIRRACEEIAGRSLPERIHRAAWRALNPEDPTLNHVGVLKAA